MDEEKKEGDFLPEVPETPPYTPSSRKKRIAAWVGVIFMVFLTIMYAYSIATGAFLTW